MKISGRHWVRVAIEFLRTRAQAFDAADQTAGQPEGFYIDAATLLALDKVLRDFDQKQSEA